MLPDTTAVFLEIAADRLCLRLEDVCRCRQNDLQTNDVQPIRLDTQAKSPDIADANPTVGVVERVPFEVSDCETLSADCPQER